MTRIVKLVIFIEIENTESREKDYKLGDTYALFLFTSLMGNKFW